jgi:hypothetical protein
MENHDPFTTLKRVGVVVLVLGLIDIAVMVYCIVNGIAYSSGLNVLAVVAGIFLIRGSLRAASIIRWFAFFFAGAVIAALVALPFLQPVDLTLTEIRLNPVTSIASAIYLVIYLVLFFWIARTLGDKSVKAAWIAAGTKLADVRVAAVAGVCVVLVVVVGVNYLLNNEAAVYAKSIAEKQLGPGFRYHVTSISYEQNGQGSSYNGVVTAWNRDEVRDVPVQWHDK